MNLLKPTYFIKKIENITMTKLKEINCKLIILDLNNTLVDYYTYNIPNTVKEFITKCKKNNIKLHILTNSLTKKQAAKISNILNIPYVNMAFKPFPFKLNLILNKENISPKYTLIIGDHILTDILMANICKANSILIEPISHKEKLHSKLVRKIEKIIINRYKN